MLKIDHLTVSYKNIPTVIDFSMEMMPGQILALVGESGSGKTTVIRAVMGLLPGAGKVTGGKIVFNGKSLLSYTERQWRALRGREISMIFQDSGAMMNPTRRVGNVFVEYLRTHEKISKKDAWKKGSTMLERMRLPDGDHVMRSYPFQLSGGMRQRVGIAMGMTYQPKLLLADEPTGALDSRATDNLLRIFSEVNRDGQTILMVTHSTKAASHAGRVLFIRDGQVFHQLYRGDATEEQQFQKISNTLTLLATGGERHA